MDQAQKPPTSNANLSLARTIKRYLIQDDAADADAADTEDPDFNAINL
jgi:hypothetical protein